MGTVMVLVRDGEGGALVDVWNHCAQKERKRMPTYD